MHIKASIPSRTVCVSHCQAGTPCQCCLQMLNAACHALMRALSIRPCRAIFVGQSRTQSRSAMRTARKSRTALTQAEQTGRGGPTLLASWSHARLELLRGQAAPSSGSMQMVYHSVPSRATHVRRQRMRINRGEREHAVIPVAGAAPDNALAVSIARNVSAGSLAGAVQGSQAASRVLPR